MEHHVGETQNGAQVYVRLIGSQAGKHIARQPQLSLLAKELFAKVALYDQEIVIEYDMKRPIGYYFTVETSDTDVVFYGRLVNDEVYTRFIKNGKPTATNYLTVKLSKKGDNAYDLSDIRIGRLEPPQPGSDTETAESKQYWSNHALILDGQVLQPRTVTKVCPY